ncbi:MAG: F0F1 ATP synthase subunit B' [Rhodospirillaceae bacterium]|nr:F0F1 ATP synthase subunit B' [Rhodospirillaceae bacterium]MBL6930249.1 F0F1 ATP synthase subunit B' [Rhodospirillales bacterium]MBL6940854.1 F0F1 ATP synthase subunit B' [Rhodospirillales bacterium]
MRILKPAVTSITGLAALLAMGSTPAHAAGLPQLDVSTFPPQLIWLGLTFVVLYVTMSRIALPKISQVLEERQHRIDDNLKKAETLKEEAEAAAQAYEAALAKARSKAHQIMLETHNAIAEKAAETQGEVGTRLESQIKDAEGRILEAKNAAMAGLSAVAAEVALSACQKVSGETLSEADVSKVVSTVMEERQ